MSENYYYFLNSDKNGYRISQLRDGVWVWNAIVDGRLESGVGGQGATHSAVLVSAIKDWENNGEDASKLEDVLELVQEKEHWNRTVLWTIGGIALGTLFLLAGLWFLVYGSYDEGMKLIGFWSRVLGNLLLGGSIMHFIWNWGQRWR